MNLLQKLFNKFNSNKKTNMEKEIYEQPDIIFELIRKYIKKDYSINIEIPEKISKVVLVASGSSYHSAAIAANFLKTTVHCEAEAFYSSEVALSESFDVYPDALYIFISQSGETTDTNKAMNKVKDKTANTLAITNTKNSTLYNTANYKVYIHAGVEKSIASTKALCAQIYCLFLIAVKVMQQKELPVISLIDELLSVPEYIKNTFAKTDELKEFSSCLVNYDSAVVLGSGLFYGLAQEGALKIKETSYVNTTAYPMGEFLHGHIAVLNKKCAAISLISKHNVQFSMDVLSKINNDYKTDSLVISAQPLSNAGKNKVISLSTESDIEFMFSTLVMLQLIAFEAASLLKRNIDAPDGLSKIVK